MQNEPAAAGRAVRRRRRRVRDPRDPQRQRAHYRVGGGRTRGGGAPADKAMTS